MKKLAIISILGLVILNAAAALACGIEGKGTLTDGSKIDGTAKVSTSWNSGTAYPRDGYYNLDLGKDVCGRTIEVYVNGYSIGKRSIPSDGNARVDFVLKGTSDSPVR